MAFNLSIVEQMILDIGPAAFCRLARLFVEETVGEVATMEALAGSLQATTADCRELGRRAHSLKNAAGSFGLAGLAQAARKVERACDSNDVAAALPATAALRAAGDMEMPDLLDLIARTSAAANAQE